MDDYDFKCRRCGELFTLTLSAPEYESVAQAAQANDPITLPRGPVPRCESCTVADIEPTVLRRPPLWDL